MSQSISILEYLDEVYPHCPLLPKDCPLKRADVRRLSLLIAADIQPIQVYIYTFQLYLSMHFLISTGRILKKHFVVTYSKTLVNLKSTFY